MLLHYVTYHVWTGGSVPYLTKIGLETNTRYESIALNAFICSTMFVVHNGVSAAPCRHVSTGKAQCQHHRWSDVTLLFRLRFTFGIVSVCTQKVDVKCAAHSIHEASRFQNW